MKKYLKPLLFIIVIAVLSHLAIIYATPYILMNKIMNKATNGKPDTGKWVHSPRVTSQSRAIVRPSPDLAYSLCVYDLSKGPYKITIAPRNYEPLGTPYYSVSFFANNSDNYYVINDNILRNMKSNEFTLVKKGQKTSPDIKNIVESPSDRGIILERRLAPSEAAFNAVDKSRQSDICQRY